MASGAARMRRVTRSLAIWRRGVGDIMTLKRNEYVAIPASRRFVHRLYRNRFIIFGAIPTYPFVLHDRGPFGAMRCRMLRVDRPACRQLPARPVSGEAPL
jgi:hypothetical protein